MATIFECVNVTKAYGGLLAVKDLSFSVQEGEIFAIVGPNGAGKTTLFDTISGVSRLTSGIIRFKDRAIHRMRPDAICRLGIARTFQTTVSFDSQTVLTNVLVGAVLGREGNGNPTLVFSTAAIEAALQALEFCDLLDKQDWLAGALSVAERKRLMFATALATSPQLLLLDEPVGGLNRALRAQDQPGRHHGAHDRACDESRAGPGESHAGAASRTEDRRGATRRCIARRTGG